MKKIIVITFIFCCLFLSISFKTNNKEKIYKDINTFSTKTNENVILNYQKKYNNSDIIAELSIENTDLVTPIAKSLDNEFYLNHLFDKTENKLGSVFLDYRNNIDDRKLLIYGHNSKNVDTEFNLLENYLNKEYYHNHDDITLKTIDNTYNYKVFSIYIATTALQHVNLNFTDNEYYEHLIWLKNNSLYDTDINIESNSDILVLQTCYFDIDNSYLILVAKKIEK